ncbi:hypothetical protein [Pseudoclavibacter caeni]|jgi:hypothetical protein|uniref:Metallopeptidase family protein n=1 Tax=Pseudoclavibacter caeni TaxID=908846 RepID=A0A7C8FXS8_9MICO|nr:hypothetical protein [Pseudoclavibacter caeni]KAB1631922.1 hypothetical protein F8O02_06245 [Pseudoclavibacter caeni]NYJ96883.1 hypothetical protein [Pseudoclavibacter caeni]
MAFPSRSGHRSRHRRLRSRVGGPWLPALDSRRDRITDQVARATAWVRGRWAPELDDVTVLLSDMPREPGDGHDPRWSVLPERRVVVLHRLPLTYGFEVEDADETERQATVEHCVFAAFAELTGRQPWEMSGDDR